MTAAIEHERAAFTEKYDAMLARQETECDTILARQRAEYHTNLARQRTELQQRHAEFIDHQRVAVEQFERDLLAKVDNDY